MKPRILITGASGQMGRSLQEVLSREWPGAEVWAVGHSRWDIADEKTGTEIFSAFRPQFVINTAAFTGVDAAEDHPAEARRTNALGAGTVARLCRRSGAILIHYSTDYIFDGRQRTPYREQDPAHPLGIYGQTKWEGEELIRRQTERYFIIRPSWIYSGYGANFIRLVLDLARRHKTLRFVSDQIGSPTSAMDLARFTLFLMQNDIRDYGTYHCSNRGEISRYDQARAILEIMNLPNEIVPVSHREFPQKARRPAYSVLSKEKIRQRFGWEVRDWKTALEQVLKTYYL